MLKVIIACLTLVLFGAYITFAIMHAIDAEEAIKEKRRVSNWEQIGKVQDNSQRVANMIAGDR